MSWMTQKDELTRTKIVEHMRAGWPQGEALQKAMAETEIAWTVPPAAAVQSSSEPKERGSFRQVSLQAVVRAGRASEANRG